MDNQGFRFVQIGSSSVIFYNRCTKIVSNAGNNLQSKSNLKKSYQAKHLTNKSKKQINKIIYHWSACVKMNNDLSIKNKSVKKRKLSMLTLTLPSNQVLNDKDCNKKYLSPFLHKLKLLRPDIHYLWVAEKQENNSIHWHIILDLFVGKIWIREVWNKILLDGPEMNKFVNKFKHSSPPSTQVDSLKKIHNSGAYITKYISKLDILHGIDSKIWDCDTEILKLSHIELISKAWYVEEFAHYRSYFNIKVYEDKFFKVFTFDKNFYSSFEYLNVYSDILPGLLFHYSDVFNELKSLLNLHNKIIPDIRPPLISQHCLVF